MARLTDANVELAHEIIRRYPRPKSALIPLLHLAQEQDGHLTDDAQAHIAELIGVSSAEVLGTASFYEMFKMHTVGRYLVNVCTNISCQLCGGEELLAKFEEVLGVPVGGTTDDGMFTLDDVECIAACTEAPACQVNYRYFHSLDTDDVAKLVDDLRSGVLDGSVPEHGTLGRVRQHIPPLREAGVLAPERASEAPVWFRDREAAAKAAADKAAADQHGGAK